MTVQEKEKKLLEHCFGRDCSNCALHNSGISCDFEQNENVERGYAILFPEPENDPVNRPSHYTDGKIEVIEFIEDKNLGFCLGNAVKYIARAGKKDPTKEIEDLNKAKWYIERRIKELKEARA